MGKRFLLLLLAVSCFIEFTYAKPIDAPVKASVVVSSKKSTTARKEVYLMKLNLTKQQIQKLQHFPTHSSHLIKRDDLPSKVEVSMNGVPVLDQGMHGSCVTFATTTAVDALLGKGNYISQLCNLELGDYLASAGYLPSGWNGSNGRYILHQIEQFGIVNKDKQKTQSCAGITRYPAHDQSNTGVPISLDEYKSKSEPLTDFNAGKFFYWESMLTIRQAFQSDDTDLDKILIKVKEQLVSNHIEEGDSILDTRFIFAVALPVKHCSAGACARYKAPDDTWALSDEIINDPHLDLAGHEMVIIGYDDNAVVIDHAGTKHQGVFVLRNSWGVEAGDNGNYYMTYDFFKHFVYSIDQIFMILSK